MNTILNPLRSARRLALGLGLVLALALPAVVSAELRVVASTPDLALVAREIGGDRVSVTALARGTEDPHFVDPKPSFIPLLRRADLLLHGGADLEMGWLPPVLNSAGNARILPGGPGNIDCSKGVGLEREHYDAIDRVVADVHPLGNPHYSNDPVRMKQVARTVAEAFAAVDGAGADAYRDAARAFTAKIDRALPRWQSAMAPFRGDQVVTVHGSHNYFLDRFGLKLFDTVEPRPGIPPPPGRIASLGRRMQENGVGLVVVENFRSRSLVAALAKQSGASIIMIPSIAHEWEGAKDYEGFIDRCVAAFTTPTARN
jgi:zinc/manganese transport system substrate-binding protein